MLDGYARRIRRETLRAVRGGGGPFIDREAAKPLLVFCLSALIPYSLGASPRAILLIFAVPALLCLAWWAFILRHWWIVVHRYNDRRYHLVTKKILSSEYREQRSPYDGRRNGSAEGRMAEAPLLGRRARLALRLLGMLLIAAALLFAYGFASNILAGLAEPVHPTGLERALIASYALFPFLLFASGVVSLRSRTRRQLWAPGALAAAAAADLAISLILYPQAMRSACEQYLATQRELAPDGRVDASCLTRR
ncbi:MAG TPA: hypothetical protein VEA61_05575 [Allosphingosinicella sp.]|nr:hypothetical protein [Allosphingosinicella sp.]